MSSSSGQDHPTADFTFEHVTASGFEQLFQQRDAGLGQSTPHETRFVLRRKLGEGGMGEVWLAEDLELKREVALKFLKTERESVEHFIDEAQITGQLEHPNIVPVHELRFTPEGRPYLVMRCVKGGSLWELLEEIKKKGEPGLAVLQRLLQIFLRVCDAVSFAHSRGVLHRDLKPENIMIGEFGEVQVMDWGLAKLVGRPERAVVTDSHESPDRHQTQPGSLIGTLCYSSPEQTAGRVDEIGPATDVYSLGAILYNLLTLEVPHESSNDPLADVIAGRLPPPRERAPGRTIPEELEAIVMHAMRTDPKDRYPDVKSLERDVQAWLEGRMVAAYRYSAWQFLRRWARRRRVQLWTALAVLCTGLLGLLGLGLARAGWQEAQREEQWKHVAARRASLDSLGLALDRLESHLPADGALVVAGAEEFLRVRADVVVAVERDLVVASLASDLADSARLLVHRARALRGLGLAAQAEAVLARIASGELPPDDAARLAVEAFERFLPEHRSGVPLPLPALALARARIALEGGEPDVAGTWVANALHAAPHDSSAGEGLLRLAEHGFARAVRLGLEEGKPAQAEAALALAVRQYHAALGVFGGVRGLRAEALLGLARALLSYGSRAGRTPFAPEVPPRVMALRCLLQLVTPDGALRDELRSLDGAEQLGARARDLLAVARELARPGLAAEWTPLDSDGDGVYDLAARWDPEAARAVFHRLGPDGVGAREATLELGAAIGERSLRSGPVPSFVALPPGPPCVVLQLGERRLVARADGVVLVDRRMPEDATRWFSADLDGDARHDLVLGAGTESSMCAVWFQEADGSLAPPRALRSSAEPLDPRLAFELKRSSELRQLMCADLDGDGRDELILVLGGLLNLSLEVWRPLPERRFVLADFVRIGEGLAWLGEDGALCCAARTDPAQARLFEYLEEPVPPPGARRFRFADGRLQELATEPGNPLLADVAGAVVGSRRLRLARMLAAAGCVFAAPSGPIPVLGEHLAPLPGLGWAGEVDGQLRRYRPSRSEELAADAAAPPPIVRRDPGRDLAALCELLEAFDLPREAARLARRGLEADGDVRERRQLERILLRSLSAERAYGELWDFVRGLEPDPGLAEAVASALEELGPRLYVWEEAAELLTRWRLSGGVEGFQRSRLARDEERLRRRAELFAAPAVDWSGARIRAAGETVALGDWILSTGFDFAEWSGLLPPAGADAAGSPAPVPGERSGGLFVQSRSTPAPLRMRRLHGEVRLEPARAVQPVAGVPIAFAGGPWRLVIDLRLLAMPHGAAVTLGLTPLESLLDEEPALRCGFAIETAGSFQINRCTLRTLPACAEPISLGAFGARPLRLILEHEPATGLLRLSLCDPEREELLACRESIAAALPAGRYLLGLGPSGSPNLAELCLDRVVLFGAARLLDAREPAVHALLDADPRFHACSRAARALLRGEREGAALELRALRELWEAHPPSERDEQRTWRTQRIEELRFAALRARLPVPEELAAALADAEPDALLAWHARVPQSSPHGEELFDVIGAALALRFGIADDADPAAELEALLRELEAGRLPPENGAGYAALAQSLGDENARRLAVRFIQLGMHLDADVVAKNAGLLRLLALLDDGGLAGFQPLRALCLVDALRRDEGLALYEKFPDARFADHFALQQRRAEEARAELEREIAAASGVPVPRVPVVE